MKEPKSVDVRVKWPSKDAEQADLESLGKMLGRGTYKQIALAAWKSPSVKKELIALMSKDVEREADGLCSKKNPSCLRKTDKISMLSFNMEKLVGEVKERAPLFHSLLSAASINSKSRATHPSRVNFGAVGKATAVCLKSRSKFMIAVQLLVTTFLYHSNWMVS